MKPWKMADLLELALIWARVREIEPEEAIDELRDLTRLGAARGIGEKRAPDWYLSQLGDA